MNEEIVSVWLLIKWIIFKTKKKPLRTKTTENIVQYEHITFCIKCFVEFVLLLLLLVKVSCARKIFIFSYLVFWKRLIKLELTEQILNVIVGCVSSFPIATATPNITVPGRALLSDLQPFADGNLTENHEQFESSQ